jgi:hypothetical protein
VDGLDTSFPKSSGLTDSSMLDSHILLRYSTSELALGLLWQIVICSEIRDNGGRGAPYSFLEPLTTAS